MKTPVTLIIFNRPDKTRQALQCIRQAQPEILMVAADGPRPNRPDDTEKCAATRRVIDQEVDWNCKVIKKYSDTNLGCAMGPSSAISWTFEQVEEAIILEDDCIPHPTFFQFCEEMLERYRDDKRIMHISGNNYTPHLSGSAYSYSFSRYPLSWGWATWRRAWEYFDFEMKHWPEIRDKRVLSKILFDKQTVYDWEKTFQFVYEGNLDCWDFQWILSCWIQNGLSIIPQYNLVTNIGFGQDSTHFQEDTRLLHTSVQAIDFPLKHPPLMMRDVLMDDLIQKAAYNYNLLLPQKIFWKFKRLGQKITSLLK